MAEARDEQGQDVQGAESTTDVRAQQRHASRTARTYGFFLKDLQKRAGVDAARAEQAAQSVLCLIEQRLMGGEVKDLEAQLPQKLRDVLQRCPRHEGKPPRKFGLLAFLAQVAEDLDITTNEAERLSRAVLVTVREHISEGEAEDVIGQLPADLQALWAREA
ncbi:DUF2267 domain-containing protein [Myxococcaceae bacterium JPH2]|nr:DUF2267 domain-containing protein [Myxococcaceae bacterium JPH2]